MSEDDEEYWRQVDEWLHEEAEARGAAHGDRRRGIVKDRDFVGLMGEVEFGEKAHQPVDFRRLREGDNGIDFIVPLRFSVDVKASRLPELLVPVGKVKADIYVLALYDNATRRAELVGWESKGVIRQAPFKDYGYGINHCLPLPLRPMSQLLGRIMRLL